MAGYEYQTSKPSLRPRKRNREARGVSNSARRARALEAYVLDGAGSVEAPSPEKLPRRGEIKLDIPEDLRRGEPCESTEEGRKLFLDPRYVTVSKEKCRTECKVRILCLTATVSRVQEGGMESLGGIQVRGALDLQQIEQLAGLTPKPQVDPSE